MKVSSDEVAKRMMDEGLAAVGQVEEKLHERLSARNIKISDEQLNRELLFLIFFGYDMSLHLSSVDENTKGIVRNAFAKKWWGYVDEVLSRESVDGDFDNRAEVYVSAVRMSEERNISLAESAGKAFSKILCNELDLDVSTLSSIAWHATMKLVAEYIYPLAKESNIIE